MGLKNVKCEFFNFIAIYNPIFVIKKKIICTFFFSTKIFRLGLNENIGAPLFSLNILLLLKGCVYFDETFMSRSKRKENAFLNE